ncbi:hypothetical protein EXIGLDRAFT_419401 [Exidia glandulosa HHB12029]|uniref:Uncharacterized protein n=1 Tax=Exidia glandulosa HHB12029 TaxID=1314781 RepID=A0A165PUZ5_EXIGL|nr:hypothetical protein EXIGLDRAFT_419401 [Exidia glandulosa HHB12029]
MAYFYTPSYLVHHPSPYPPQQFEQPAWPPALDLGDQFYPAPLYSSLSLPLSPAPRAPSPPIPIYNVSYSLAGAMTPVEEPKSHPAPPQCRPAVLQPAQPLRYAETENSSLSPQSLRYSPDIASPEEFVYEPDIDGSSLSSLSPSPSRAFSVKEEDMASDLSSSDTPSQAGRSRRATGARASRGRRAQEHGTQEDDDLPPQTVCSSSTLRALSAVSLTFP